MADRTSIEWTDATWNPVTGCTKLSDGCDNCYAEVFAERFRGVQDHPYEAGFDVVLRPERLEQPLRWQKPRMVFVNSMSDLFHETIPTDYIRQVFDVMEQADRHIFQVLTKRSSLMRYFVNCRYRDGVCPPHIWLGVSIESHKSLGRMKHLKTTRAGIRFISFEPLLGPIGEIDLTGIHWVIAGGESGSGARPADVNWFREIRDQCNAWEIAFFFKQWGGRYPKSGGNELDGLVWQNFPETLTGGSS